MFKLSTTSPSATYQVTSSVGSVDEGSTVTITLQTTGVQYLQQIPYTIEGTSLADFVGLASLSGAFVVQRDGSAQVVLQLAADNTTEGPEAFDVVLFNGSRITVAVNDTSINQAVSRLLNFEQFSNGQGFPSPVTTGIFTISGSGHVVRAGTHNGQPAQTQTNTNILMTTDANALSFNGANFTVAFSVPARVINPVVSFKAGNTGTQTNLVIRRNGTTFATVGPLRLWGEATNVPFSYNLTAGANYTITAAISTTLTGSWIAIDDILVTWTNS